MNPLAWGIPGKAYEHFFSVRRPSLDRMYRMDILINKLAYSAVWTKNNTVPKRTHMKPKLYQHVIDKTQTILY